MSDAQFDETPIEVRPMPGTSLSAPRIPYWHLWTGGDGVSRQSLRAVEGLALQVVVSAVAPVWAAAPMEGASRTIFAVLPAGVVGEWHENPLPQWIVVLSGRWFVESMDGTRVEMGPGEVSFGGDQGTRPDNGRRGHRSGALGADPCALLLVQFDIDPSASLGTEMVCR